MRTLIAVEVFYIPPVAGEVAAGEPGYWGEWRYSVMYHNSISGKVHGDPPARVPNDEVLPLGPRVTPWSVLRHVPEVVATLDKATCWAMTVIFDAQRTVYNFRRVI